MRGRRGGDSLIVSPPASLSDGAQVKVEPDNATGQQGGTSAGGDAKKAGPPGSATPGVVMAGSAPPAGREGEGVGAVSLQPPVSVRAGSACRWLS